MFLHRHSERKDQFDLLMAEIRALHDLMTLGRDGRGEERFARQSMIETEQGLERATTVIADRARHDVCDLERGAALARAAARGMSAPRTSG
jgi:hypothetical protein